MIPLFEANPMLVDRLPHWPICQLPTPVSLLSGLGDILGHPALYVKRDDITGEMFGGNKVRCLEFLLPAAHRDGGNIVIGLAGTSMALASNVYSRQYKLPLKTYLVKQAPSVESRENLRYFSLLGADLGQLESPNEIDRTLSHFNSQSLTRYQHPSHRLSTTSPLAVCGYVNAGLELAAQVKAGEMPQPDLIYIAAGLLGTTAGLLVGLRAGGLSSRIIAISHEWTDVETVAAGRERIAALVMEACDYLRVLAPDFPVFPVEDGDLSLVGSSSRGRPSLIDVGLSYKRTMAANDGVHIEPTWTAQVIGLIIKQAESGDLDGKNILFWHTANSRSYPADISSVDYKDLPSEFWPHFEEKELARINKPLFG